MDFYHILGVPYNASEKEIRKAYRELAKKYHPDKNKDKQVEEIFKNITNAYNIISDPSKRERYNLTGTTDDDPIIEYEDIVQYDFEVEIDYEDFILGGTKNFRIIENIMVDEYGIEILPVCCTRCKGKIKIVQKVKVVCKYCEGTGQVYKRTGIPGEKLYEFDLTIEPKSWIGRIVYWKNKKILLTFKESTKFRNEDNLLIYSHPITVFQSLIGITTEIKIIDIVHKVVYPNTIVPDTHLRIPNSGLYDSTGQRQDLIIEFDILFPEKITEEQRKYIELCI